MLFWRGKIVTSNRRELTCTPPGRSPWEVEGNGNNWNATIPVTIPGSIPGSYGKLHPCKFDQANDEFDRTRRFEMSHNCCHQERFHGLVDPLCGTSWDKWNWDKLHRVYRACPGQEKASSVGI